MMNNLSATWKKNRMNHLAILEILKSVNSLRIATNSDAVGIFVNEIYFYTKTYKCEVKLNVQLGNYWWCISERNHSTIYNDIAAIQARVDELESIGFLFKRILAVPPQSKFIWQGDEIQILTGQATAEYLSRMRSRG